MGLELDRARPEFDLYTGTVLATYSGISMTTIITYGTFDLFHVGHLRLFRRLKYLGDRVVVGCSTDQFNEKKGKTTIMPYEHRAEILNSITFVDLVIPESCWEQKRSDIGEYGVDIFAIGDDWAGTFDELEDICQVVYMPRTTDISTTEVKHMVQSIHQDQVGELKAAVSHLTEVIERI